MHLLIPLYRPSILRTGIWRRVISVFVAMMTLVVTARVSAAAAASSSPRADPRNLALGSLIPSEGYCDQPYVVILNDGTWLCVLTTGRGQEGQGGQHIVSTTSRDQGRTWSALVDIEPASGPEASWVVPLKTPAGRVYAFYTYNADNLRSVKGTRGRTFTRVDTLGRYACKSTDDGGRSWSKDRTFLPMRTTEIDRANPYQGAIHFFWGVGKPIIDRGQVFLGASKVGAFGDGFMETSEGVIFASDNILTELDTARHQWQMLPEGDKGLRPPDGLVCDEHNLVALGDGSLFCIARTTQGWPVQYYSTDRGRTWSDPQYATYAPGARRIKQPRANTHLWKTAGGQYLLWYHNHGGKTYDGRNPAWISGGVERDGRIFWSEPEILFYDADPKTRMSYPDLVEQAGRYWITETQKTIARVHEVDASLLQGMWKQQANRTVATDGLVLDLDRPQLAGKSITVPELPRLADGGGFTIDLQLKLADLSPGQVLVDARPAGGKGFTMKMAADGAVRLEMGDGLRTAGWDSDKNLLKPGQSHHLTAIVDGGPKIITFVIDGVLCDGGMPRQYGWGRFDAAFEGVGNPKLQAGPQVGRLRVYDRYLRTSQAVGNHRADDTR